MKDARDPLPDFVAMLRAQGFEEHARALDDALCGSTSGEIYCNLWVALVNILGDARIDEEANADAARLLARYDVFPPDVEDRHLTTADRLEALIVRLRAAGQERDARTLQDVVAGGASGGEILDRSLVELGRLVARRETTRELRDEARVVIASIRDDQRRTYGVRHQ